MANDKSKKERIYDLLKSKNIITVPYEDFSNAMNDDSKARKMYDLMSSKKLITVDYDKFRSAINEESSAQYINNPVVDRSNKNASSVPNTNIAGSDQSFSQIYNERKKSQYNGSLENVYKYIPDDTVQSYKSWTPENALRKAHAENPNKVEMSGADIVDLNYGISNYKNGNVPIQDRIGVNNAPIYQILMQNGGFNGSNKNEGRLIFRGKQFLGTEAEALSRLNVKSDTHDLGKSVLDSEVERIRKNILDELKKEYPNTDEKTIVDSRRYAYLVNSKVKELDRERKGKPLRKNRLPLTPKPGYENDPLTMAYIEQEENYRPDSEEELMQKARQMYANSPEGYVQYMKLQNKEITEEDFDKQVNEAYDTYLDWGRTICGQSEGKTALETLDNDLAPYIAKMGSLGRMVSRYGTYAASSEGVQGAFEYMQSPEFHASEMIEVAQRLRDGIKEIMDAVEDKKEGEGTLKQLLKGTADSVTDINAWLAANDLSDSMTMMSVVNKYNNGEPLTKEEQILMDAIVLKAATDFYYGKELSGGYKAGQTTGASIPFMVEFALVPYAKADNVITKGIIKYAQNKFLKKAAPYVAKIITPAVVAGTVDAPAVAADAVRRVTGTTNPAYDEEQGKYVPSITPIYDEDRGVYVYGDYFEGDTPGEAIYGAFVSRFAENLGERFLDYVNPKVGNLIMNSKVGKFFKENKVGHFIKEGTDAILNNKVAKATHFTGLLDETAEEAFSAAVEALLTWDATPLEEFNTIETVEGLLPMQVAFSLIGMPQFVRNNTHYGGSRQMNRKMKEFYDRYGEVVPKGFENETTKNIMQSSARAMAETIKKYRNKEISREEAFDMLTEQKNECVGKVLEAFKDYANSDQCTLNEEQRNDYVAALNGLLKGKSDDNSVSEDNKNEDYKPNNNANSNSETNSNNEDNEPTNPVVPTDEEKGGYNGNDSDNDNNRENAGDNGENKKNDFDEPDEETTRNIAINNIVASEEYADGDSNYARARVKQNGHWATSIIHSTNGFVEDENGNIDLDKTFDQEGNQMYFVRSKGKDTRGNVVYESFPINKARLSSMSKDTDLRTYKRIKDDALMEKYKEEEKEKLKAQQEERRKKLEEFNKRALPTTKDKNGNTAYNTRKFSYQNWIDYYRDVKYKGQTDWKEKTKKDVFRGLLRPIFERYWNNKSQLESENRTAEEIEKNSMAMDRAINDAIELIDLLEGEGITQLKNTAEEGQENNFVNDEIETIFNNAKKKYIKEKKKDESGKTEEIKPEKPMKIKDMSGKELFDHYINENNETAENCPVTIETMKSFVSNAKANIKSLQGKISKEGIDPIDALEYEGTIKKYNSMIEEIRSILEGYGISDFIPENTTDETIDVKTDEEIDKEAEDNAKNRKAKTEEEKKTEQNRRQIENAKSKINLADVMSDVTMSEINDVVAGTTLDESNKSKIISELHEKAKDIYQQINDIINQAAAIIEYTAENVELIKKLHADAERLTKNLKGYIKPIKRAVNSHNSELEAAEKERLQNERKQKIEAEREENRKQREEENKRKAEERERQKKEKQNKDKTKGESESTTTEKTVDATEENDNGYYSGGTFEFKKEYDKKKEFVEALREATKENLQSNDDNKKLDNLFVFKRRDTNSNKKEVNKNLPSYVVLTREQYQSLGKKAKEQLSDNYNAVISDRVQTCDIIHTYKDVDIYEGIALIDKNSNREIGIVTFKKDGTINNFRRTNVTVKENGKYVRLFNTQAEGRVNEIGESGVIEWMKRCVFKLVETSASLYDIIEGISAEKMSDDTSAFLSELSTGLASEIGSADKSNADSVLQYIRQSIKDVFEFGRIGLKLRYDAKELGTNLEVTEGRFGINGIDSIRKKIGKIAAKDKDFKKIESSEINVPTSSSTINVPTTKVNDTSADDVRNDISKALKEGLNKDRLAILKAKIAKVINTKGKTSKEERLPLLILAEENAMLEYLHDKYTDYAYANRMSGSDANAEIARMNAINALKEAATYVMEHGIPFADVVRFFSNEDLKEYGEAELKAEIEKALGGEYTTGNKSFIVEDVAKENHVDIGSVSTLYEVGSEQTDEAKENSGEQGTATGIEGEKNATAEQEDIIERVKIAMYDCAIASAALNTDEELSDEEYDRLDKANEDAKVRLTEVINDAEISTVRQFEELRSAIEKFAELYKEEFGENLSGRIVNMGRHIIEPRRVYKLDKEGKILGYYNPATDEVFISSADYMSAEDIVKTKFHEIVAHKGLRRLFGDRFNQLCDAVHEYMMNTISSEEYEHWREYAIDELPLDATEIDIQRCMADEWMADRAESGVSQHRSIWNKIVDWFRSVIRDMGLNIRITERDVAMLLYESQLKLEGRELTNAEKRELNSVFNAISNEENCIGDKFSNADSAIRYGADGKANMVYSPVNGVSKEEDKEYMDAAKAGDTEKCQEIVDRVAERLGWRRSMHGTEHGAFTIIDMSKSDDGRSFFSTPDEDTASTYTAWGKKRITTQNTNGIYKSFDEVQKPGSLGGLGWNAEKGYIEEMIKNGKVVKRSFDKNKNTFDNSIKRLIEELDITEEQAEIIKKMYTIKPGFRIRNIYVQNEERIFDSESDAVDYANEIYTKYSKAFRGIRDLFVKFNNPYIVNANGSNWDSIIVDKDAKYEVMQLMPLDHNNPFGEVYIEIGDKYKPNEYGGVEVVSNDNYKYIEFNNAKVAVKWIKDNYNQKLSNELLNKYLSIDWKSLSDDELYSINTIREFVVNNKTKQFSTMYNTRTLAQEAEKNGYDGVIIDNVSDNGGMDKDIPYLAPATVYISFNPNQIKSAEAITYDDNGNIIPLSQRFNTGVNEIRYSRKPKARGTLTMREDEASLLNDSKGTNIDLKRIWINSIAELANEQKHLKMLRNALVELSGKKIPFEEDFYEKAKAIKRKATGERNIFLISLMNPFNLTKRDIIKDVLNGRKNNRKMFRITDSWIDIYMLAKDYQERIRLGKTGYTEESAEELWSEMSEALKDVTDNFGISFDNLTNFIEKSELEFDAKGGLKEMWNKWRAMSYYIADKLKEHEILSEKEYEDWKKRQYYVPQRNAEDENDTNIFTRIFEDESKGNHVGGKFIALRKAKGRTSLAGRPVAHMANIAFNSFRDCFRNDALRCFYNIVTQTNEGAAVARKYGINVQTTNEVVTERDDKGNILQTRSATKEDLKTRDDLKAKSKDIRKKLKGLESSNEDLKKWCKKHSKIKGTLTYGLNEDAITFIQEQIDSLKKEFDGINTQLKDYVTNQIDFGRKDNQMLMKIDGQSYLFEVNDDIYGVKIAQAFDYMPPKYSNKLIAFNNGVRRYISNNLTTTNPFFAPKNLKRDVEGSIAAAFIINPMLAAKLSKNIWNVKTFIPLANYICNNKINDPILEDYIRLGGAGSFTSNMSDLKEITKELERLVSDSKFEKGKMVISKAFTFMSEFSEMYVRYAIYRSAVECDYTKEEAMAESKDLNVNFDMSGRTQTLGVSYIRSIIPFFNASISSLLSLDRALFDSNVAHKNKGALARAAAVLVANVAKGCLITYLGHLFVAPLISSLFGFDDDDEETMEIMNEIANGNREYYEQYYPDCPDMVKLMCNWNKYTNLTAYSFGQFKMPSEQRLQFFGVGLGADLGDMLYADVPMNGLDLTTRQFQRGLVCLSPVDITNVSDVPVVRIVGLLSGIEELGGVRGVLNEGEAYYVKSYRSNKDIDIEISKAIYTTLHGNDFGHPKLGSDKSRIDISPELILFTSNMLIPAPVRGMIALAYKNWYLDAGDMTSKDSSYMGSIWSDAEDNRARVQGDVVRTLKSLVQMNEDDQHIINNTFNEIHKTEYNLDELMRLRDEQNRTMLDRYDASGMLTPVGMSLLDNALNTLESYDIRKVAARQGLMVSDYKEQMFDRFVEQGMSNEEAARKVAERVNDLKRSYDIYFMQQILPMYIEYRRLVKECDIDIKDKNELVETKVEY